MRAFPLNPILLALASFGAAAALPSVAHANAQIVIINADAPGEGFNDPTPRAPIGGNAGTTVGEQRLIAFQHAANIWGAALDSSVQIRIRANFDPLTCSSTSAVLGSAGANSISRDFPNAPLPGVWYHDALADKLSGVDLAGDPSVQDINARFNSSIGTVAGCLTGADWYYGLDNNHGANLDLVTVLLHEFGHGLGFSSFTGRTTGVYFLGFPSVYDVFLHDNTQGKDWLDMTDAERLASIKNGRNVAWTGVNVTNAVPSVLTLGTPALTVDAPAGIARNFPVGAAAFGPALSSPGVSGDIVQALDAVGPATDACSAITNNVAGKIALVDRGTCTFTVKAANVQAAGAIGMVVADNAAGSPPAALGGADGTITIPSVRITLADGNLIKANLGTGVHGTLGVDMTQYAGADTGGRAIINTPDPIVTGSSVSHWDPIAFRNQLMEPAINGDLTHSVAAPEDLTLAQMRDVGWYADGDIDLVPDSTDACLGSTLGGNVVIDSCQTGVPNTFFANGCTIQDKLDVCAETAADHEAYTACTTQYTNGLKDLGVISNKQKSRIQSCAGKADLP